MDRNSRSELVATIESQNEKIRKYETKLRDIIQAYKGLLNEKEALEASIQALSAAQAYKESKETKKKETQNEAKQIEYLGESEKKETPDDSVESETINDEKPDRVDTAVQDSTETADDEPVVEQSSSDSELSEIEQLRGQLQTLSSSLTTVMQEKSKMEASYISEKKKLRHEMEEQEETQTRVRTELEATVQQLTDELQVCHNKVRVGQQEREHEQTDHAVMLKELQKLVAAERMAREDAENQLDDVLQSLDDTRSSVSRCEELERRVKEQVTEIDALRSNLRAAEQKAAEPPPQLTVLQRELSELKAQHCVVVEREQQRASESEALRASQASSSEQRIARLEARIGELSQVTGNYERLRIQDQESIVKLRERISQLALENSTLTREEERREETEELSVQEITEKMTALKTQLRETNVKADRPVDVEEFLAVLSSDQGRESLHTKCQQELQAVKEDFERYKLRAQSVLKHKSNKENTSPSSELDTLKKQVAELKERLHEARQSQQEADLHLQQREQHFSKSLQSVHEKHKTERANQETAHQQKMTELENEIRRHRERTVALLAEKDSELDMLRSVGSPERLDGMSYVDTYTTGSVYRQVSGESTQGSLSEAGAASSDEGTVSELLSHSMLLSAGRNPSDTALLHFSQEQARKDVEISTLRRQKHSLQVSLRELQQNSVLKAGTLTEEIERLQEEIRKLERNKSRENANLEYLKNVVYRYMVSNDVVAKQQMVNAISTILQFSPHECGRVHSALNAGWWSYSSPTKKH